VNARKSVITGNRLYGSGLGIGLSGTSLNNRIFHNDLFDNTGGNAWLEPSSVGNDWDDGYPSGGNYWDDYTGVDLDGDGIGDSPYDVGGLGLEEDAYPLMEPCIL